MKMTTKDFDKLKNHVSVEDTAERREAYRNRDARISNIDKVSDINKRYRFDLFYHANGYRVIDCTNYSDAHIYSALKKIVKDI